MLLLVTPCRLAPAGLVVVPGSHKSVFSRPRTLFQPFGNATRPNRPPAEDWLGASLDTSQNVPDGLLHITPEAGDVIIMSEALTHGVLPWVPTDRPRRALTLRYKTGSAYVEHMAAWQAKDEGHEHSIPAWMEHPQRQHSGMSFGTRWTNAALLAASPSTRALIGTEFVDKIARL